MTAQTRQRNFWQRHVQAWWASGQTQRAYCQEHGLPEAQFSHWKGRLPRSGERRSGGEAQLVPVKVIEEAPPRTTRATVHGTNAGAGDLALVFGNGLRLEIGNGFDAAALRRVLEALGHVG